MAMTGAERTKKYRESLSEEDVRRANHASYERRKLRLQNKIYREELRRLKGFRGKKESQSSVPEAALPLRVYEFYKAVKLGLTLAWSDNMLKKLDEEQKEKADLWALDCAQRMIEKNWNFDAIQNEWVRDINIDPKPLSDFFYSIVDKLDDDEVDVWEYIYKKLCDKGPREEAQTTAYIIERETGVEQSKCYNTLQHLQMLSVIDFRDDLSNQHVLIVQPVFFKRGTTWKE